MTKYARITEGTVQEVFTPPEGFPIEECFHPDVLGTWSECPDHVEAHWTHDGENFHPPAGIS